MECGRQQNDREVTCAYELVVQSVRGGDRCRRGVAGRVWDQLRYPHDDAALCTGDFDVNDDHDVNRDDHSDHDRGPRELGASRDRTGRINDRYGGRGRFHDADAFAGCELAHIRR